MSYGRLRSLQRPARQLSTSQPTSFRNAKKLHRGAAGRPVGAFDRSKTDGEPSGKARECEYGDRGFFTTARTLFSVVPSAREAKGKGRAMEESFDLETSVPRVTGKDSLTLHDELPPLDDAALTILRLLRPDEPASPIASTSTASPTSAYLDLRQSSPALLSDLPPESLASLIIRLVKTGGSAVAFDLVDDVKRPSPSGLFSDPQRVATMKALILLWETRAWWMGPAPASDKRSTDHANLRLMNHRAVASYFSSLLTLSGRSVPATGLTPTQCRTVLGALRSTKDPLLWDESVVEALWYRTTEVPSESTGRAGGGVNTYIGTGLLVAWLEGRVLPQTADERPNMTRLVLKVFGHLLDRDFVSARDAYLLPSTAFQISQDDRTTITVLGSLARAGARQSLRFSSSITDGFFSTHASRGPLRILRALAVKELSENSAPKGGYAEAYAKLAPEVIRLYLDAESRRPGSRVRLEALGSPAQAAVDLHLSLNAFLPLGAPASSRAGGGDPMEEDAEMSGVLLDRLVTLGRPTLLVEAYLGLLRQRRPRAPGWSVHRVLAALSTLGSTYPRVEEPKTLRDGQGAAVMSRTRLVKLVLVDLMGAEELRTERDPRMGEVRRFAVRLALEHARETGWTTLLDQHGEKAIVGGLAEVWKLGWVDIPPTDRPKVPLPLLKGATVFARRTAGSKATRELLMSVVRLFLSDRTPTYDPRKERYFVVREPDLDHQDLTTLIRAHLAVGGELGTHFARQGFERMARQKWVPTVEDMELLGQVLEATEPAEGDAEKMWKSLVDRSGTSSLSKGRLRREDDTVGEVRKEEADGVSGEGVVVMG